MSIDHDEFVPKLRVLLFDWLPRQRWFDAADGELDEVTVIRTEVIQRRWPLLVWVPLEVQIDGAPVICQTVLGVGPEVPDAVSDGAILGELAMDSDSLMVFDALDDPELASAFAAHAAGSLDVGPVVSIIDEPWLTILDCGAHWELVLYRRLESEPHPDVEVPAALAAVEAPMVRKPAAVWRKNRYDLASVRGRPRRGLDGETAARASIDQLLASRVQPRENTKDIAHELFDLGQTIAAMHIASAAQLGISVADPTELVELLVRRLPRQLSEEATDLVAAAYGRLAHAEDLGVFIRVHGNLALRSLVRERRAWIMTRFGCSPDSRIEFEREQTSPLADLAALVHDLARLAAEGLDRAVAALEDQDGPAWEVDRSGPRELAVLAEAWESRCVDALIAGYTSNDPVHRLLPVERVSRDALLTLFELEMSIRESVRVLSARPEMLRIPAESIDELAQHGVRRRW